MDSPYSSKKVNMLKGYVSKLMIPPRGSLSPYSSQESLVKYLRSKSPASSSGKGSFRSSMSPLSENTPMKLAEDDVLVVDGVLVASDFGVGGSKSNSSSGSSASYKTEICQAWEDLENCRFGSKCQFAHGKEELRPSRFSSRNKSELCKSYASTGSCIYGSRCRLIHPVIMETTAVIAGTDSAPSPAYSKQNPFPTIKPVADASNTRNSTMKHGSPYLSPVYSNHFTIKPKLCKIPIYIKPEISPNFVTIVNSCWSPLDDAAELTLPSHPEKTPSREEIDNYIQEALYGPSATKRLPVFRDFCPE